MAQTDLSPVPAAGQALSPQASKYARQARAASTVRAYRAAWSEFQSFAQARAEAALPATANLVAEYISALADHGEKPATIQVKLAAIAAAHRLAKQPDPTVDEDVRMTMAGIRRQRGTAPQKKAPALLPDVQKMLAALPDTLAGRRDRALLLIGFAGAFRRSELVDLDVADIRLDTKVTIKVKRAKTDQEGQGLTKVIPRLTDKALCPVTALQDWLEASGIQSGAVFRQIDRWGQVRQRRLTPQSVALIIKLAAKRAGLESRQFAGHSLRSGFITEAAQAGVLSRDIMAQTGHKSEAVMRDYIQDAGLGALNAAQAAFGERAAKA